MFRTRAAQGDAIARLAWQIPNLTCQFRSLPSRPGIRKMISSQAAAHAWSGGSPRLLHRSARTGRYAGIAALLPQTPDHDHRPGDRLSATAEAVAVQPGKYGNERQGHRIVGYNVQTAVDTTNHLIVAHEVTNVGTDDHQLSNIAEQARTEMGVKTLDAVADRGYYAGEEIRACEEAGITVTLPKPMTSNSKAAGRFGKQHPRRSRPSRDTIKDRVPPSTNGPRRSTPEPRAAIGRVTSSFASAHGQCSFSMNANRA